MTPIPLKRIRQPHTLVDGAHGVELGGALGAADQVRLLRLRRSDAS